LATLVNCTCNTSIKIYEHPSYSSDSGIVREYTFEKQVEKLPSNTNASSKIVREIQSAFSKCARTILAVHALDTKSVSDVRILSSSTFLTEASYYRKDVSYLHLWSTNSQATTLSSTFSIPIAAHKLGVLNKDTLAAIRHSDQHTVTIFTKGKNTQSISLKPELEPYFLDFADDSTLIGVYNKIERLPGGYKDSGTITVYAWNLAGRELSKLSWKHHTARNATISRDREKIAIAYNASDHNSWIMLYNTCTYGFNILPVPDGNSVTQSLAFNPQRNLLALTTDNKELFIVDLNTSLFADAIHLPREYRWMTFSPDSKEIALATAVFENGKTTKAVLSFLNIASKKICSIELPAQWINLYGRIFQYLPNGHFVFVYDNHIIVGK